MTARRTARRARRRASSGEALSGLSLGATASPTCPAARRTGRFAGNGNYNAQSGSVDIVINKADAVITVDGYTVVYDGDAHGATGTATGVNGEDLGSLLNLGASFTNVPGGTVDWTFAATATTTRRSARSRSLSPRPTLS